MQPARLTNNFESATPLASSDHGPALTRSSKARKPDDFLSDDATAAFIRRTLCSGKELLGPSEKGRGTPRPIEEVLPPLTSSNAVDMQLYAIISVIIKEFVQTWYSKITPDQVFVNEVMQIIAHCTRALEQRLRKVDLEALCFDEIPGLLEDHLKAFRIAQEQTSGPQSLVSDPRVVYHALHPHPALSPVPSESIPSSVLEQRENESVWRQMLVQGLLAVLLPTEDLENGCLRALVVEIFAEMILGNGISGKACEGWLLWEGITKVAEVLQPPPEGQEKEELPQNSLDRYGLLSAPVPDPADPRPSSRKEMQHGITSVVPTDVFWTILQYAILAFTWFRTVVLAAVRSSALPVRSSPGIGIAAKRPMLSMRLWSCVSQLVELERRMPWLSGFASLLHWLALAGPGRVGGIDGVLDR
ncbi:uncharacterized protein EI97DRAFT_450650 [Westerdykella ornata]|uniref:PXA domain-containing protein n=1 Tax=Westerdykella ornata TaxID=318751 RepID=A0A6A6JLN9_WESOR|nr:uncharacterized protein EI97DRAFT_450650 [Westerdykella ornata]KAF2275829.1 hypothetical protein EI97DRAFT_450650 [Westerdykella ornata]